jgi:hypothetical protein
MGILINGQVGWRAATVIAPSTPSLWTSVYAVYNADATGLSSLKTSLYAAYNGESNTNDSFGSNNGTAQGGLTYAAGKIGNAFVGNGTNAYVSLPNNSWNFTGTFSINIWAYLSSSSTNSVLCSNYYYSSGGRDYGFLLEHQSNGNLRFYMQTSSNTPVILSTSYSGKYNSWKMITITKLQNGSLKMYIDGVNIGTNNNTPDVYYNSINYSTICAASYLGTTYGYLENNGKIDALNIWQKELSASEITDLYNSGNGAQYITDNFYKPTTNDALGTNNGTAIGGLTYTPGKIGTAFNFNGTNAYVSLPDNSLNFAGDFSVSCWFYASTNTTNSSGLIGNYNDATATGFGMYLYQNRLYAQLANSGGKFSTTYIDNSVLGAWNHAVMVFKKGTGFYLYMNGVLRNSYTTANNANAGTSPTYSGTQKAYIGLLNYPGDWWWMQNGGKIDAANTWTKALTTTEITELYNSGNAKQYPN